MDYCKYGSCVKIAVLSRQKLFRPGLVKSRCQDNKLIKVEWGKFPTLPLSITLNTGRWESECDTHVEGPSPCRPRYNLCRPPADKIHFTFGVSFLSFILFHKCLISTPGRRVHLRAGWFQLRHLKFNFGNLTSTSAT